MSKKYFIAPSILSADFTRLGEEIATIERAGADWVHVDIMDGHFVPNMSMGRKALEACKQVTRLPLDVHLMVQSPESFVEWYAESGADHLTVHIEATPNIHRVFLYLPLEHCEDPAIQDDCVRLFTALAAETRTAAADDFTRYAIAHRDVIARFGRFPHRNAILGRSSSAEESAYLERHGGF